MLHRIRSGAGDTVTNSAGLAGFTTTGNIDLDIEAIQLLNQLQRLTNNHAAGFAGEELVDRLAVDNDGTSEPRFMKTRATALLRRPVP
jgi:hypothetical protein